DGAWLNERLCFDPSTPRHEVRRYQAILEHLRIDDFDGELDVAVTAGERVEAQNFLRAAGIESGERVIGIHPGSSVALKRWQAERFLKLAASITERKLGRIVLVG